MEFLQPGKISKVLLRGLDIKRIPKSIKYYSPPVPFYIHINNPPQINIINCLFYPN